MKQMVSGCFILTFFLVWGQGICFGGNAAVLVSIKGQVMISENGKEDWLAAESGMTIPEGFYIKVGDKSEAALMLNDRSQIRLRDNSLLCLKKSGSAPDDTEQEKGLLDFLTGKFWMRNKRQVMKPDITTPSLNMSIRGTELMVTVSEDMNETRVTALEGEILCENALDSRVITRGIEAVAKQDGSIQTHVLVNPESSVQWLLVTPRVAGPADAMPSTVNARIAVDLSQSAMRLLAANQLPKAREAAREAVRVSPETASANIAMATILQTTGQFEQGMIYAKKGLQADPYSEPALLRSVELLLGQDRVQEAHALINEFKGEKTGLYHMLTGYLWLIKQEVVQAEQSFDRALFMEEDLAHAWLGLGLTQYAGGRLQQGLEKLETASLLNPLAAFPHNYLGKALYEAAEYEEATVEFNRARQLDPNDPTPYLYLAIMAQDSFAPAQSIRHLKKAIAMNDNRFFSRSRFLLDMDRSVKNINLAAAMSSLGLHEWARHMGNKALWQDHANSSAYLFRAGEAVSLSRVDVSTLSDLKRAQLLNPVNSNTFPSYTDYYTLLEIPEHLRILEGYAGNNETFGSTMTFRGGWKNQSYLASLHLDTTDGVENHTESSARYLDLQYKAAPFFNHQFTLGVRGGEDVSEDVFQLQNTSDMSGDGETENDYYQINAGYHWQVSPGQNFLVSLQFQDRQIDRDDNRVFEMVPNVWYNWTDAFYQDDRRYRAEAIDFIQYGNHALTLGAAMGKLERDVGNLQTISNGNLPGGIVNQQSEAGEPEETEIRVFVKDNWSISEDLMLDLGLGWCQFDADNKSDISRILPQIGAVLEPVKGSLVRASFFKEIQPDYLSATLKPVEVAGFPSVTGTPSGTLTESWGLAFDREWGTRFFTSIDAQYKKKRFNTPYRPHSDLPTSWENEEIRTIGASVNYLFSDHFGLSLTQRFSDISPDTPGLDRRDSETGLRLSCVYPFGLAIQTAWWFVDQRFDDTDSAGIEGDDFILGSLSVRQRLLQKNLEIFLKIDNFLDQSFSYVPVESMEGLDLPSQGLTFLAGFRIKF